ncbi:hypothetical protein NP493_466g04007 [Ridgeia piscesae]|uniref:Secreted protein n=1 Tax=Ridgeia piscesae TaxID=27915 RepID=A0AAD9NRP8_RIDPI|nr:hypothetical protein NP493_466g04007 [Ridgeia piscesae]
MVALRVSTLFLTTATCSSVSPAVPHVTSSSSSSVPSTRGFARCSKPASLSQLSSSSPSSGSFESSSSEPCKSGSSSPVFFSMSLTSSKKASNSFESLHSSVLVAMPTVTHQWHRHSLSTSRDITSVCICETNRDSCKYKQKHVEHCRTIGSAPGVVTVQRTPLGVH